MTRQDARVHAVITDVSDRDVPTLARVDVWESVYAAARPGAHAVITPGVSSWWRVAAAVEDAGFDIRDTVTWVRSNGDNGFVAEPVIVARRPPAGTVASNTLQYGTGGINVDANRVPHRSPADLAESVGKNQHATFGTPPGGNNVYGDFTMVPSKNYDGTAGRWPSNVILDTAAGVVVDAQSGVTRSSGTINRFVNGAFPFGGAAGERYVSIPGRADIGGASRFFHMVDDRVGLFRFLVRLVVAPGGVVLDPFPAVMSPVEAACTGEGARLVTRVPPLVGAA